MQVGTSESWSLSYTTCTWQASDISERQGPSCMLANHLLVHFNPSRLKKFFPTIAENSWVQFSSFLNKSDTFDDKIDWLDGMVTKVARIVRTNLTKPCTLLLLSVSRQKRRPRPWKVHVGQLRKSDIWSQCSTWSSNVLKCKTILNTQYNVQTLTLLTAYPALPLVATLSVCHSSYVSYAFPPERLTLNFNIQHLK